METLIVIFLAIIAYILWKMYRQKEDERIDAHNKELDVEYEKERQEKFKDYPHIYGKLEANWLDVFAHHAENGIPMINLAFMLYLQESTKIDFSEGSMKWDSMWDLSEELLEDLEKYHEGSSTEHLIALCTYWQIAAEEVSKLIDASPEKEIDKSSGRVSAPLDGKCFMSKPFTNLESIPNLFPKKSNHPEKELVFRDEKGFFPRESDGSDMIHKRITV